MKLAGERRHDVRLSLERPAKIKCLMTGRYLAGRTVNVSAGGAMLHVDHPSLLVPGQRVAVGLADTQQDVILRGEELSEATVVRSVALKGAQTVAVQFDQRQALLAAG